MVKPLPSKQMTRVRFPSLALMIFTNNNSENPTRTGGVFSCLGYFLAQCSHWCSHDKIALNYFT